MNQSYNNDLFLTTNQDYGSFYSGRLQHGQINSDNIAFELAINDQIRNERRQLPSIAYDIMFNKHDVFEIVSRSKKKYQPVTSRRQLKYMKSLKQTNEERQMMINKVLESYKIFIQCIYSNKPEKDPKLSNNLLELIAYELFLLHPEIPADVLAEYMIAITVPHEYLGMSSINANKPYPGTETDCMQTPCLPRLLDHFKTVKKTVSDNKQSFDSNAINSQRLEGVRYIYNPFTNSMPSRRI